MIDRLFNRCHVVNILGNNFRMRENCFVASVEAPSLRDLGSALKVQGDSALGSMETRRHSPINSEEHE